jgi:8-oxo-dGTP pyrophosphatase MutT (NUDIX family)
MPDRGGAQFIPRPTATREGRRAPWAHLDESDRFVSLQSLSEKLAAAPAPRLSPLEGSGVRASAVLAPLYAVEGEPYVVLTRRAQHLRSHRGEVSFPGGGHEGDETLLETALREANEEIGLDPREVTIIGELDHLETVTSRSFIVPFVGVLPACPELEPSPNEVELILHVPLKELMLDGVFREERWGLAPLDRPIYFFEIEGDTIWGATAVMLRNLLAIATGTDWR